MLSHSRTLLAAALSIPMLTGAAGAASAHMAPGFGGHAHFGHFGHHHFHGGHGRVFVGLDDWDDGYAYGYGDGCSYLRFKAHETGRPYWWHRYHACIDR